MPKIRTRSDSLVVIFDDTQHINRFVVTMSRAVIVNGYSNVELFDQFVETVKGIKIRIGRDTRCTDLFGELKSLAILGGVFSEPIHSVTGNRQSETLQLLLRRGDFFIARINRQHAAVELNLFKSQILCMLQCFFPLVASQ